jgi:hypothetical protein
VDLTNYRVEAIDGEIGAVHDLLFDDQQWAVRYFVVDTRPWIPRKVLVSPVAIARADWTSHHLRLKLTRDQVKEAPSINSDPPVSRQEEEQLVAYYAWPAYWAIPDLQPHSSTPPEQQEVVVSEVERLQEGTRDYDPHLRSLREVTGYRIAARDGPIGHVQGFFGDDVDWVIRYMIAHANNRQPGKRVLLPPSWISGVDWTRAEVAVDVEQDQVERSPPYGPATPLDRGYEKQLYDFYDRPPYWNRAPSDSEK